MEYNLSEHSDLIPFIPQVCNELGLDYQLDSVKKTILIPQISNRGLKSLIRKAWARKESWNRKYKVLTRENIGETNISGVIPENELYFFETAYKF